MAINNIFNSMFGSNGSSGVNLGEYASIKNGSYKKVLTAYLKQEDTKQVTDEDIKAENTKNSSMSSAAQSLAETAREMLTSPVWEKKTAEDGTEDYDRDSIIKAVRKFVEDYTKVIENAGESDVRSVLRSAVNVTGMMKNNAGILREVGINIGEDNKLSIDEDKLGSAKVSTLTTIFKGYSSIAGRISQKASGMASDAANANKTYTRTGAYNSVLSKLLSSRINEDI